MGSKNKKQRKRDGGEAKGIEDGAAAADMGRQIITDPRFASAHTDPRFRRVPKRETKVAIDARFQRVFTDKRFSSTSAPVDKRGKRRRGRSGKDSLREYYRIEEEKDKEKKRRRKEDGDDGESKGESEVESESESDTEREKSLRSGGKLDSSSEEESGEEESEEEDAEEGGEKDSTSEKEEEDDTEGDDEVVYEDWMPELAEENIPAIEKETRRLAVVNMDWRHVSAMDLYVMLSSFLPKDGQISSVAVYPSEFGLQRMKEEEIHGPVGLFDGDKRDGDDDGDEEDEDIIDQKLRAYEISRLKYYYAVVECDSSATADYLYKACDGVEFERSSNKLDLRFIPDSMEFKHPPRDVTTEAPANYEGLDFHSRALQLSKVNLSWDDDEPHRSKTLKRKFKTDQLAELELREFLASDESESDDDEDQPDKQQKKKEKYHALIQSGDIGPDEDEKEDGNLHMEVTFNTELEDLSKRILEKKDRNSETVWEAYLRNRREKRKERKNKQNKDSSSSDDDEDYRSDTGQDAMKEVSDDFFVEEPPLKRKKEGKKKQKDKAEKEAAEEASRAELELLLADEEAADGDGDGVKGYNIKRKGKKGRAEIAEEKIPAADLDDPRFSALFTSPLFSLDPTDPQFKRSAAYARQLAQKQKGEPTKATAKPQLGSGEVAANKDEDVKPDTSTSKKEKHELSSAIKSVKLKIKQQLQPCSSHVAKKDKEKQGGRAESSALIQRVKKKAKASAK